MASLEHTVAAGTTRRRRISDFRRIMRVLFGRGLVVFGMVVILVIIAVAVFAPWIAPYDPDEMSMFDTLSPMSWDHLLGTDTLGRDLLSRIIFGARTSLLISFVAVGSASIVGMFLGLIAGYLGGWTNAVIMRFIDALMAFPMIVLAMMIAALLGGGTTNVIIALSIGLVPAYTRLMCGQVLSIKENDYILASEAGGAGKLRIIFDHLFINSFPPLIVLMTMMLGSTVLAEAGLSFLGIGILPPTIAWGSLVAEGRSHLASYPILSLAPGIMIMLLVFSCNMVGDGLRDALDPRLRGLL